MSDQPDERGRARTLWRLGMSINEETAGVSMSAPSRSRSEAAPGLLASAWRYRWLILAVTIVAGALGYVVSSAQPATFEATARLFLTDPRQVAVFGGQRAVDPERYVPQQSERITSAPVLERTSELLSAELSPTAIARRLEVAGDIELDLIEITATSGDAALAAELANTAARAYTEVSMESRLRSAREVASELELAAAELDEQIADLQEAADEDEDDALADQLEVLIRQRVDITSRAQQQLVEARVFGSGVDFLEEATVPAAPVSPSPRRDAVLAAVLGAALAAAAAFWRAGRHTVVEGRNQPSEILGAPLLGVLPLYRNSRGARLDDRLAISSEAQESYEFLLSSIEYAMSPAGAKSLLITSAEPGQGKTEVAIQLAVTALLQGRRTLLIDGDLRVRSLTHLVGADGGPGLVDLAVSGPRQYRTFVHTHPILGGQTRLPVLPAGSTADEGAASLRQSGVSRGLKVIAEEADLVLIDSAPILATADTTTLSSSVDAMLLVVRVGTPLSDLQALRERLSFVGCPVLGYVYITSDHSDIGYAFGYGSYRYRHSRDMRSEVVGLPDDDPARPNAVAAWLREPTETTSATTDTPSRPPLAARDSGPGYAAASEATGALADERRDPGDHDAPREAAHREP